MMRNRKSLVFGLMPRILLQIESIELCMKAPSVVTSAKSLYKHLALCIPGSLALRFDALLRSCLS